MRQEKKKAFIIGQCYLKASCLPDDNGSYLHLRISELQKESHRRVCKQHLYLISGFENICMNINPSLEGIFRE